MNAVSHLKLFSNHCSKVEVVRDAVEVEDTIK